MNKIVPWKQTLKYWSNWMFAVMFLLPPAWMYLPPEWKEPVIQAVGQKGLYSFSALAALGFVARNVKQTFKELDDESDKRDIES